MRLSLSVKLGLLWATMITLIVAGTSYALVFRFRRISTRELIAQDRELARTLTSLRNPIGQLDFDGVSAFVERADKVENGLVYALAVDKAGVLQKGVVNPKTFAAAHRDYREQLEKLGKRALLARLAAGKIERRGRIKEYALNVPSGRLRLGFDVARIDRWLSTQVRVAFVVLAFGIAVGVLAAFLLGRRMVLPLRRLAKAMEAVASGDLDQTLTVASQDELASVANSFNQMMRTLRRSRNWQRSGESYLGSAVLSRLSQTELPQHMPLDTRAVAIVHVDLHGAGPQLLELSPKDSVTLLNEYLAIVLDALQDEGGVVLWLNSHELQAVFGAFDERDHTQPTEPPERAAIRAAGEVVSAIKRESRRRAIAEMPQLQGRVGVSAGQVVLGNIGSSRRTLYTAIGEPVELARQAAELTRPQQVLVTEQVYRRVSGEVRVGDDIPLVLDDGREIKVYPLL